MLRRIYIKHIKCSNDSSRLWWNWQFCEKRSENWSRPIPSIGLGRQTTTALLDVFDDLMHMLSSDTTVDMIYLDCSKTFDKVDHGVLLHKLKDLGITCKLGIWFFQFLTNITHNVRIPCGISKNSPVLSDIPQGTFRGPLLFLIMISDINKGTTSSKLISFADDTQVYSNITKADDCDNFQYDLNSIYNWAVQNNMC